MATYDPFSNDWLQSAVFLQNAVWIGTCLLSLGVAVRWGRHAFWVALLICAAAAFVVLPAVKTVIVEMNSVWPTSPLSTRIYLRESGLNFIVFSITALGLVAIGLGCRAIFRFLERRKKEV